MLGLKRHAESFGEETETGIKAHISADELAREVGTHVSQVRDILYRQKYDARLKDWLVEIKQRAIIDVRM